MSRNVHLRDTDRRGWKSERPSKREERGRERKWNVLTARRERGREDCGEREEHRGCERARERDGGRTGTADRSRGREIGGRIGWDVQVRQYTKGSSEITIFHSFARSNYFVQLKYRFSPPSPRLSRVRLLQCRPLSPFLAAPSPPPPPPFNPPTPPSIR